MILKIINRYKQLRTNAFLSKQYKHNYAFIGMGQHSLTNLYTVLNYLQVPLKYICVTSEKKAQLISGKFHCSKGVSSIDEIISDDSVKGVFVATSPKAHYSVAQKVLKSGKSLFIEKPPCSTLDELNKLIALRRKLPSSIVVVGLQKRYSPCVQILKKRLKNESVLTYNMRYLTGAYPEGNALIDLFIHPLDLVNHLFGEAEILACENIDKYSYMVMLKHGNIVGNLELSTSYTWCDAQESLSVNTKSGIYELSQMEDLTYSPKQTSFWGVPLEKVWGKNKTVEYLYSRNNFSPIMENNQIYTQGFYNEIKSFVDSVEKNYLCSMSDFHTLKATYELINKIVEKRKI